MKKLSPIFVVLSLAFWPLLPAGALAGSWKGGDHHIGYRQSPEGCSYAYEGRHHAHPHRVGGPPPWAPAHGWRRKHGHRAVRRHPYFCADQALDHLPDGETIVWETAGAPYRITPTQSYVADGGRYCREYTATAVVAGREQQIYGTACRQADGAWELQN